MRWVKALIGGWKGRDEFGEGWGEVGWGVVYAAVVGWSGVGCELKMG